MAYIPMCTPYPTALRTTINKCYEVESSTRENDAFKKPDKQMYDVVAADGTCALFSVNMF